MKRLEKSAVMALCKEWTKLTYSENGYQLYRVEQSNTAFDYIKNKMSNWFFTGWHYPYEAEAKNATEIQLKSVKGTTYLIFVWADGEKERYNLSQCPVMMEKFMAL